VEELVGRRAAAATTGFVGDCFLQGIRPLAFAHFDRPLIALQLLARVIDPRLILQGSHSLCGVVSFMQGVALNNPLGYVQYVTGLATGRNGLLQMNAGGHSLRVHVRSGSGILRKHDNHRATYLNQDNYSHRSIPAADYVALASLRDSSNILPYRSPFTSRMLEGASIAGDYRSWMVNAGFTNVEDHTHGNPFWARGPGADARIYANLQLAEQRAAAGQVVLMSMTRGGRLALQALGKGTSSTIMEDLFMGHTVLLRKVDFVGRTSGNPPHPSAVGLHIVTWGKETNLATLPHIPWDEIMSSYRGFVSGLP
jgi:hypothetical protein